MSSTRIDIHLLQYIRPLSYLTYLCNDLKQIDPESQKDLKNKHLAPISVLKIAPMNKQTDTVLSSHSNSCNISKKIPDHKKIPVFNFFQTGEKKVI